MVVVGRVMVAVVTLLMQVMGSWSWWVINVGGGVMVGQVVVMVVGQVMVAVIALLTQVVGRVVVITSLMLVVGWSSSSSSMWVVVVVGCQHRW